MRYIELSYYDMPYMLKNQKCIKRKNQILYIFEKYAFVKIIKEINKLHCLFPSYKLQVIFEEKAKELLDSDLSDKEKRQEQTNLINKFIKKVIEENK